MLKINCFTTSYKRPYYLYSTINNILNQSYKDIVYGVNICIDNDHEQLFYQKILQDFTNDQRLKIGFSYPEIQHLNYLNSINLCEDTTDSIYIKIDDDDIYGKKYIQNIYDAFDKSSIDILSSYADMTINNNYIDIKQMKSIGNWVHDQKSKMSFGMPPTYSFNHKAKDLIKNLSIKEYRSLHIFEDAWWRECWRKNNLHALIIENDFIYHIHGKNISSTYLLNNSSVLENDFFAMFYLRHKYWDSYVFLNKRNNRLFNINNNDHGKFTLVDNQLNIDWDNYGSETFIKKNNHFELV